MGRAEKGRSITMTRHICKECKKSYERDPAVQDKWNKTRPETEGLCLECIGRLATDKAMEEP
jgi:hypothetical protein